MIVAWHEVPGSATAPSRRVRCDSCRCTLKSIKKVFGLTRAASLSRMEPIPKCLGRVSDHLRLCVSQLQETVHSIEQQLEQHRARKSGRSPVLVRTEGREVSVFA